MAEVRKWTYGVTRNSCRSPHPISDNLVYANFAFWIRFLTDAAANRAHEKFSFGLNNWPFLVEL